MSAGPGSPSAPAALYRLAEHAGVGVHWLDYRGTPQEVAADGLRRILTALELPCETEGDCDASLARVEAEAAGAALPQLLTARVGERLRLPHSPRFVEGARLALSLESGERIDLQIERGVTRQLELPAIAQAGYHRLALADDELTLAVAPPGCFGVADLGDGGPGHGSRRIWGIAAQLYALRRAGDGGIGDFTALAELARRAAQDGADAIAVSPAHAPFAADVERFSPYAPSSRLFANPLHVDCAEAFGDERFREIVAAENLGEELQRLEALPLVDWPAAARARYAILRKLFDGSGLGGKRGGRRGDTLAASFRAFRARGGAALEDHARFEALHTQQFGADPQAWHWRTWAEKFRDPRSATVAEFAAQNASEVSFHVFLQWLTDRGLAAAQKAARDAGMRVGLIGDLAVGTDSGGSHAWSRQHDLLAGLSVGAPPDQLNAIGQNWGLTAFSPRALAAHGYTPFIEMLRASLKNAGGLRIDHVLGLKRLWLVPDGGTAADGAYLHYPLEDLLRLIALESWRHRALIVGEDLGTVPDGLRPQLESAGVMGMRVLWFEREHELFVEPARWSAKAMATTTTHDLPTVAGWWAGRDVDWRVNLGHLPPDSSAGAERSLRAHERQTLWDAFVYAGVAQGNPPAPEDGRPVIDAAIRFVARTPAPLAIVPIEDFAGLDEAPNLPGTTDEHPNWRRRLPVPATELLAEPAAAARLASLREARGDR